MNNLIEQYLNEFFKEELQHTPGPWEAEDRSGPDVRMYTRSKTYENYCLCEVYKAGSDVEDANELKEGRATCKLISRAPDMLRSLCRTYLTLLVKFAYGQNDFCTSARISLNDTLASLRNEISNATGLECRHLQDTFEDYVVSIKEGIDIKQHSAWVKQGRPGEPQITK